MATDEARVFFSGADLKARGHTSEWVGHDVERCSVWARSDASGPVLRLQIRPVAAHRTSGAAEEASATPLGHGWNGSFLIRKNPEAAVLVDCDSLPGKGLLVLTESAEDVEDLSEQQVVQVARFATESARLAAKHFGCQGTLGERPPRVDRTDWQRRSPASASGTCRGVVDVRAARGAGITTVTEKPAGRALTESCSVETTGGGHYRLTACYGASAKQEIYLDTRYPGSVKGALMRPHTCRGAMETAYYKLVHFRPSGASGGAEPTERGTVGDPKQLLERFAAVSAERHGCPR
ncbi:hypothetical protein [Streptomyces sp. MS1.AVA.4]|uniref:Uncharacterized protein n=1 Tax=Streptomyces pratisoli TaxID=3139917 RepID=A0ACC6QKL0_9ACTN